MTSHELARKLLELRDLPIIKHFDDVCCCWNYDDTPTEPVEELITNQGWNIII